MVHFVLLQMVNSAPNGLKMNGMVRTDAENAEDLLRISELVEITHINRQLSLPILSI